jgi:hypothetical protein
MPRLRRRLATQRWSCLTIRSARASLPVVDVGERGLVVAVTSPAHAAQIGVVGDAVVFEGDEQLASERLPNAQLGGDVAIEVGQERLAVGTFGHLLLEREGTQREEDWSAVASAGASAAQSRVRDASSFGSKRSSSDWRSLRQGSDLVDDQ